MAGAVANPQYMGYKALYRTVLEDSKRGIAKALRVFADPEAFPVLIHCIHGGRTLSILRVSRIITGAEHGSGSISACSLGCLRAARALPLRVLWYEGEGRLR